VSTVTEFAYPSPEVLECPFGFYKAARDEAPVHRLPTGEFMVTRWEDVTRVARSRSSSRASSGR
jgi:cytochrome P450